MIDDDDVKFYCNVPNEQQISIFLKQNETNQMIPIEIIRNDTLEKIHNNIILYNIPNVFMDQIDPCEVCGELIQAEHLFLSLYQTINKPQRCNTDCLGIYNGNHQIDQCGICNGQNKNLDCHQICYGPFEIFQADHGPQNFHQLTILNQSEFCGCDINTNSNCQLYSVQAGPISLYQTLQQPLDQLRIILFIMAISFIIFIFFYLNYSNTLIYVKNIIKIHHQPMIILNLPL